MRHAALVAALLLLGACSAADAATDIRIEQAVTRLRQWLWPHHKPAPASVAVPLPPSRPKLEPVAERHHAIPPAAQKAPEVAQRVPLPKARPKAKAKATPKAKPQGKTQAKPQTRSADDGLDLPYSCAKVRWATAMFTKEYLEAEGERRGLTEKQKRQARACLAKR